MLACPAESFVAVEPSEEVHLQAGDPFLTTNYNA